MAGTEGTSQREASHRVFPLVRQLSRRLTPLLLRLPVTANQVTLSSIATGLSAAACFAGGAVYGGALLFIVCQVLDNCDGEVARARGHSSHFGGRLDEIGDWLVHSLLFLAIGQALSRDSGEALWAWLGVSAALGSSINAGLDPWIEDDGPSDAERPEAADPRLLDQALYTFRVLFDADFCFILLAFSLAGKLGVLLAGAAVGAHAHWMAGVWDHARRARH